MASDVNYCASCGGENPSAAQFCMQCGAAIRQAVEPKDETLHCANCDAEIMAGTRYCWQCGAEVNAANPASPASTPATHVASSKIAAPKPEKPSFWPVLLGWWPLLFILAGVIVYLVFGEDDFQMQSWGVALVYAGLMATVVKAGHSDRWGKRRSTRNRTGNPAGKPGLPWQSSRGCAMSLATLVFMLVITSVIFVYVDEELTSNEIPDNMWPAVMWVFMKPTDLIRDGLDQLAEIDVSGLPLSVFSNPFCPSFNFSSSDGDCYTDSHGMRMCSTGTGGAPSASDCWKDSGTYLCQDSKGNIINMSAVCKSYPCTPLCKTLGIN